MLKHAKFGSPVTINTNKLQSTKIKVFTQTKIYMDVEYIMCSVNTQTKSIEVIKSLLRKAKLKHRDPNLFYLTLERYIRKDGLKYKSIHLLGDDACPLQLQQCCSDDVKFNLQMKDGTLVKIFCHDVVPDVRYKCLSLSKQTTVDDTIELILYCLSLPLQSPSPSSTSSSSSSEGSSISLTNQYCLIIENNITKRILQSDEFLVNIYQEQDPEQLFFIKLKRREFTVTSGELTSCTPPPPPPPPPPPALQPMPPLIRPRRRRRYSPAQLEEDLSKLDILGCDVKVDDRSCSGI